MSRTLRVFLGIGVGAVVAIGNQLACRRTFYADGSAFLCCRFFAVYAWISCAFLAAAPLIAGIYLGVTGKSLWKLMVFPVVIGFFGFAMSAAGGLAVYLYLSGQIPYAIIAAAFFCAMCLLQGCVAVLMVDKPYINPV